MLAVLDGPVLSLIVMRVSDLERSVPFYTAIGLTFEREQHGSGPIHYAAFMGSTVLELYPASERFPIQAMHLGFTVKSIDAVFVAWRQTDFRILSKHQESSWGLRAVVADLDGHRIELTQRN